MPGDPTPSSTTTSPSAEGGPTIPGPVARENTAEPPSNGTDAAPEADLATVEAPDASAEFTMVGGSAPPSRPAVPSLDDDPLDDLSSVIRRRTVEAPIGDARSELADSYLVDDSAAAASATGPRIAPGALSQRTAAALGMPVRHTTVPNALTAFLPPPNTEAQPSDLILTDRNEPG
jgi:hypothetical protein